MKRGFHRGGDVENRLGYYVGTSVRHQSEVNDHNSYGFAQLAGLGASVLGAHSVQNGMRVVKDELPDLPSIDIIVVWRGKKLAGQLPKL
jgi:hypothetical protein